MQSSPGTIGYAKEKTTGSENGKPKEKEKEKENEKEKEKDIYMGASPRAKGAYIYPCPPFGEIGCCKIAPLCLSQRGHSGEAIDHPA